MSIPVPLWTAAPLIGGEYVSGMCFVLTLQVFWEYGVQLNILLDKKRQTMLNFLMMLASINGFFGHAANATQISVLASNVTTLFAFIVVQYGLVIINHNTLIRINVYLKCVSQNFLDRFCIVMYFLPFFTFIPVYLMCMENIPQDKLINQSSWNKDVFKPMTLIFIFVTEMLATISDIVLLVQVRRIQNQSDPTSGIREQTTRSILSRGLFTNYIVTWMFLILDIFVKLAIMMGYPLLFDSILSIITLAMRARCNLHYGLNMRRVLNFKEYEVSAFTPPGSPSRMSK
jgi:hypothetical protein